MGIIFFIVGLVLFIGLILVHEWGHFILSRRNGVEVEEFGLGFPPRAKILKKHKGTVFSLNWLPLGGFVKLKGEHDIDDKPGSFGAATTWVKSKILLAGVVMNLLTAIVLMTMVALIGMPKIIDNQSTVWSDTEIIKSPTNEGVVRIGEVVADSPAERAGIRAEDEIETLAGITIDTPDQVSDATKANAGQEVEVVIKRGDETITKQLTLNEISPHMGVGPYSAQEGLEIRRSTWSAPVVAVMVTRDFTVATLKGLGNAVAGLGSIFAGAITGNSDARTAGQTEASSQVAGPVGIFYVLYEISQQGIGLVLFIIAIISLTLAIMNVLPIPALDGGRMFVILLFRLFKKPLKPDVEERIHGTGFAALMLLFVVITIVDIRRFL